MSILSYIKDKYEAIKGTFKNVLIPEWKTAYKFLTVQLSTIGVAASATWLALPDDQKASILGILGVNGPSALAIAGFVMVILARVKSQPSLSQ